jgi:elongation factor G
MAAQEQQVKGKGGALIREVPLSRVRNIGIMAHIDAGKTTTTERILYYTGKTYKIGEVHEGAAGHGLDGPGAGARHHDHVGCDDLQVARHVDQHHRHARPRRLHRRGRALAARARRRGGGVRRGRGREPQTETVWRQANKYNVPRMCFVNKMDRVGADFFRCVDMIKDRLDATGRNHAAADRRRERVPRLSSTCSR